MSKSDLQTIRKEELGLTREEACDLIQMGMTVSRLEYIEKNNRPTPEELRNIARAYRRPSLLYHYCLNTCDIGKCVFPKILNEDLSQLTVRLIDGLNRFEYKKDALIDISADDRISADEIEDFVRIEEDIEKLTDSLASIRLWRDSMLAKGMIDTEKYSEIKRRRASKK